MAPIRELLASSSAELQSQLLGSVIKSDRKVQTRLSADFDCLRGLDLWMIDLIPDTRAFQILEDILKVCCLIPALIYKVDQSGADAVCDWLPHMVVSHQAVPALGAADQHPCIKAAESA